MSPGLGIPPHELEGVCLKPQKNILSQFSLQSATVANLKTFAYSFRFFPAEIRQKIYGYLVHWHGQTPAFLAALRADRQLYFEALEVFLNINTFKISEMNFYTIPQMPPHVFQTIKLLTVDYPEFTHKVALVSLTAVEELTIIIDPNQCDNVAMELHRFIHSAGHLLSGLCKPVNHRFDTLKRISIETFSIEWRFDDMKENCGFEADQMYMIDDWRESGWEVLENDLEDLSNLFRTEAKLLTIGTGETDSWFWQAEIDETLSFNSSASDNFSCDKNHRPCGYLTLGCQIELLDGCTGL